MCAHGSAFLVGLRVLSVSPGHRGFSAHEGGRALWPHCAREFPLFLALSGVSGRADKISRHPAIRNSLEELAVELSDKDLRGKRQPCQLLVNQALHRRFIQASD